VGRACWWLAPLHELVLSTVLASPKVFADQGCSTLSTEAPLEELFETGESGSVAILAEG